MIEPLQPFAPPQFLQNFSADPALAGSVVLWLLYLALLIWLGYTLVAVYHWIKYSHAAKIAVPAIALHLVVSFALVSYALTGAVALP